MASFETNIIRLKKAQSYLAKVVSNCMTHGLMESAKEVTEINLKIDKLINDWGGKYV